MIKSSSFLFLLIGISFFSSLSFAQSERDELTQELEKTVADLEALAPVRINEEEKQQPENGASPEKFQAPVKMQANFLTNLLGANQKHLIGQFMQQNPFREMDREALRTIISGKMQGTPLGNKFNDDEKFQEFFLDVLQDEHALPKFFSILQHPDKVKYYGFVAIAIFVLTFILNLLYGKSTLLKRLLFKISLTLGALILNIGAFYFLFQYQINPVLHIFFKHYL